MPNWIDAHCHLSDPRVSAESLAQILSDCRQAGIGRFVLGGVDPAEWARQDELLRAHPGVFAKVVGLHPWRVDELAQQGREHEIQAALVQLEALFEEERSEQESAQPLRAAALGETGLDAARDRFKKSRDSQIQAFEAQLALADRFGKPVVLHIVRAHAPALEILTKKGQGRGLIHSFSGTWNDARRYLDLGYHLSISARLTYPNATDLHETVRKAPADRLVFETDSPDQPPYGETDKANSPLSLLKVVQKASEIRSETPPQLLDRSRDVLTALFQF